MSRFKIVPDLGYGEGGYPEKKIPPNENLILEATLLDFQKVNLFSN